jgi:hypothetical protein
VARDIGHPIYQAAVAKAAALRAEPASLTRVLAIGGRTLPARPQAWSKRGPVSRAPPVNSSSGAAFAANKRPLGDPLCKSIGSTDGLFIAAIALLLKSCSQSYLD